MSQLAPIVLLAEVYLQSVSLDIARVHNFTGDASALLPTSVGGALLDTQPIDEPESVVPGQVARGLGDLFYNRIIIEPPVVDAGNMISAQTFVVNVFNAYFTSQPLSSFSETGSEGIEIQQPATAPFTVRPLQNLQYVLTVGLTGPFSVNAVYELVIGGVSYTITVTGYRLVLFPFPPDWASGVLESLEWRTNILRAHSGAEQRRQLRALPRMELSFDALFNRDSARRLDNLMWGWQNRSFGIPFWPDKTYTTGDIASGSYAIPVVTAGRSFRVDTLVVLYLTEDIYEVAEIETVSPTSLTVKSAIAGFWVTGSLVMPAFVGHLPSAVAMRRITDTTLTGSVTFLGDPRTNSGYLTSGVAAASLNSTEVITKRPNWSSETNWEYQFEFGTVDFGGMLNWVGTETTPRILRQMRWLFSNRNEINDFRALLGRLKGMAKAVYIPSWNDDMSILSTVAASDQSIRVTDFGFERFVGAAPARDGLMIRLRNGSVFYRQITGVSSLSGNTYISFAGALGVDVQPIDVVAVHLMSKFRLASDRIDIKWETNTVAVAEINFLSVPQ